MRQRGRAKFMPNPRGPFPGHDQACVGPRRAKITFPVRQEAVSGAACVELPYLQTPHEKELKEPRPVLPAIAQYLASTVEH